MRSWKIFILAGLLFFALIGSAQKSNERCKWISAKGKPFRLDTVSVVPGSIIFPQTTDFEFEYELSDDLFTLKTEKETDSVRVCYQVFPYDFYQELKKRAYRVGDSLTSVKIQPVEEEFSFSGREELFPTENIYKSGMISRGISFGKRQDIFVNSVLNLQMEGKLSEQLNIRASITDQNIPYQPEGNTKLVQDFDNVFFEIYNRNFSVRGGDLVIRNMPSDFLRFNRSIQGAGIQTRYELIENSPSESSVNISVSKGKFASYQLDVIDGVMGPYKIYGPENEPFIIIVANSENVYIDGRLMERGFNNDYVIDYNTAEITFTGRVMITKYSRVNIDFEYTNQEYSRSVLNASHSQKINDLNVSVQFYQEKDNRGRPLTFDLSQGDKEMLSRMDPLSGSKGFIPGWDSVSAEDHRILYKRVDTIDIANRSIRIFKYSSNPDSAFYQVAFSEVPENEGSYIRKEAGINGHYFQWVGQNNGNYVPLRTVSLPSSEKMLSLRSSYHLDGSSSLFSEIAFSSHNGNLYNKGFPDKNGLAVKSGMIIEKKKISFLPGYYFDGQIDLEYDNKNFEGIDRFREVEFNRDWSYSSNQDSIIASDKILNAEASVQKDKANFLESKVSRRIRSGIIDGWQGQFDGSLNKKWFGASGEFFLMNNHNNYYFSDWMRYEIQTYLKSKYVYPGYSFRYDNNTIKPVHSDSIISTAMSFDEHTFFLRNSDTLNTSFNASYSLRNDRLPRDGEMKDHNLSRTVNLSAGSSTGSWGNIDMTMTYRQSEYLNDTLPDDQKSLLGRLDWFTHILKKHIRSELTYAIGNSRELKREYIFYPVPTGQGTHTWRDDDGDEIQDLNEFYPAINPDERNYIKLFTPTDEYVLAYENNLNYRFSGEMPREWKNQSGIKKILGRFSNVLTLNYKQKINQSDIWDNIFFKGLQLGDEQLISYRENLRNVVYFNRAGHQYGAELIFNQSNRKQLISNGFEARDRSKLELNSRVNIERDYTLNLSLGREEITSRSDFLEGRNYGILEKKVVTGLIWQPSRFWRLTTSYSHSIKFQPEDAEQDNDYGSAINRAGFGFRYSKARANNFDITLRYHHIKFSGLENSALGYELLEGLKPGNNLSWSLNWQKKLFAGLQMNISYEGRKSGDLNAIHVGRMQMTAFF